MQEIERVLEYDIAGDPSSGRKWTRLTPQKIASCLTKRLDIIVCATTIRRLLKELGYSLKGNRKCISATSSPDRNEQFGIIKRRRKEFAAAGEPSISVDTKSKELIGRFKNPGRTWCRQARKVNDHDFRSQALGVASPYGVYDVQLNSGMLAVGKSADTPEFAVNSIVLWWERYGKYNYPTASRILILADGGGSNGARCRAWKKFLQEKLADRYALTVTVCHYPAGASKWNPIEHRMFSEISKNWAGEPLETFESVVNFARETRTHTGLRIEAHLDEREYQKGIKVSDKEMAELSVDKDKTLGKWNYTVRPRSHETSTSEETDVKALLLTLFWRMITAHPEAVSAQARM